jgi:heptosyltransferase-2
MRTLIVAPAWIGDMVMAHTLIRYLAATAELHVLAPRATIALTERMPEVHRAHLLPVGHGEFAFARRRELGRALADCAFDQAIVLPNSWKSALVPMFANVPRRTGWLGEWRIGLLNDWRRLDPGHYPRMVDRFLALGIEPGAPLPEPLPRPHLAVDRIHLPVLLASLGLTVTRPVLALCPGAEFGPAKRWPPAHFAQVAVRHVIDGGQVWLFGSTADREATAAIVAQVTPESRAQVFDLAGRTRLLDAVDLLSLARCVVSNDSGLMHVAAAVGRPLIALYGSTSPDFTPPLSTQAYVLREALPCSPCFDRVCRFGHTNCLQQLQPARVIAALDGS